MPDSVDPPGSATSAASVPPTQPGPALRSLMEEAQTAIKTPRWGIARLISFRFLFLYFGLYFLPYPVSFFTGLWGLPIPLQWIGQGAGYLSGWFEQATHAAAIWVGGAILGLGEGAVVIQPTGSGDTMAEYVKVFCIAVLAIAGTIAWTFADLGRWSYPRLGALFRVYMRYALSMWLLSYGFAKVPPLQFQPPGPESLIRTYGESSPMGLLWTFMGFSPAYTMFAGVAEIVPGLLLLFRRTATLGALIGAATMFHVVVLNFCYDVPVKLFSMHLLAAALVIAAPDLPRLLNVFVLNRPVPAAVLHAPQPRWRWWTLRGLKAAYLALLLGGNVYGAYQGWYMWGPGAPRPPLTGVYEVGSFRIDGEQKPPLWTDQTRWRRFIVSRRGFVNVQYMGDQRERFSLTRDEAAGTIELKAMGAAEGITLTCTSVEGGLILEGPFRDHQVRAELRKLPEASMPIQTRGFHWIQEFPFNR